MNEQNPVKSVRCKLSLLKIILVFLFVCVFNPVSYATEPFRVAVFPVENLDSRSYNWEIQVIVSRQLSGYDFIEVVPVERDYIEHFLIDPLYMWTEIDEGQKQGGIIWNINRLVVEDYSTIRSFDYFISGYVIRSGSGYQMDFSISSQSVEPEEHIIKLSGSSKEEIRKRVSSAIREMTRWLKKRWVVFDAEEAMQRYMGSIYSHIKVIERLKRLTIDFPESIKLRALLLDAYMKEAKSYGKEIIKTANEVINLYDKSDNRDALYIRSLNLDPFEIVAGHYEAAKKWNEAVKIRLNAIKVFPFNISNHKDRLGEDYYYLATHYRSIGKYSVAMKYYKDAMRLLSKTSVYYQKSSDALKHLQ